MIAGELPEEHMATPSGLRIGDADREATAASLREHFALGRLTQDEFNERLNDVFAAKTDTDLAKITSDLPHVIGYTPGWTSGPNAGAALSPGRQTWDQQPGQPYSNGHQHWHGQGSAQDWQYYRGRPRRSAMGGFLGIAIMLFVVASLLPAAFVFRPILLAIAVVMFIRRIIWGILRGSGRGRRRWPL
jgi:hypothetical protein